MVFLFVCFQYLLILTDKTDEITVYVCMLVGVCVNISQRVCVCTHVTLIICLLLNVMMLS